MRAILFLIEHPKLYLFESLIKFGRYYFKDYGPWILKFFDRLAKKEPVFFKNKIKSFLKTGDLILPKRSAKSNDYIQLLDYSGMDNFAKVFYTRYLRDFKS